MTRRPTRLAGALLCVLAAIVVSSGTILGADPAPTADPAPSPTDPAPTADPGASPTVDPLPIPQAPAVVQLQPVTRVRTVHRAGQTFITWPERTDITGETYRIFRSARRITPRTLKRAKLLGTVGESSSLVWSERRDDKRVGWTWRNLSRAVIPRQGSLGRTTGLFVWTPNEAEVAATPDGAHYAVVVRRGSRKTAPTDSGRVRERVAEPRPVEVMTVARRTHVFLQYMDLHTWNPTFEAPNATNEWLGFERTDPGVRDALSVAYAYTVAEPDPRNCPGRVIPAVLPLVVELHGFGRHRGDPDREHATWCNLELRPMDGQVTRWFGFARDHDYRRDPTVDADDRIANFTEMRVLRMIDDLLAHRELGPRLDPERVYLWGGSMGGTGVVNMALRYPQVFAAAYAWSPIPDYSIQLPGRLGQIIPAWGPIARDLPTTFVGPTDLVAPLQAWEGTGTWTWENGIWGADALRSLDSVPIGFQHGISDLVSPMTTQGSPFYRALDRGRRTASVAIRTGGHPTKGGSDGLPATLRARRDRPFWGMKAIRSETVPGFSDDSRYPDMPPTEPAGIYTAIEWSASWNPWDGPPVDEEQRWAMSFRTTDDVNHFLDITPRRLQRFVVDRQHQYRWTLTDVATGDVREEGDVTPDKQGLLNVRIAATPEGTRLTIDATPIEPARRKNRHHKRR